MVKERGNGVLKRVVSLLALLALGAGAAGLQAQEGRGRRGRAERPRLAVLISIDQFRADYLVRFSDLFLPAKEGNRVGGFRYLMERGAWYPDCQYEHHRTVTATGHAVLGTGAQPYAHGIVGNTWYDRATGKSVYSSDDPKQRVVGAGPGSKEKPMSAANLLVTTVGDELETATGGAARTVSLSLKDRAAILLTGHHSDSVVWLDETTGGWVSSTAYARDGRLPEWAARVNERRLPDQLREKPWQPSVPMEALSRATKPGRGSVQFSHKLTGEDYVPFTVGPTGNEFVFVTAQEAVTGERLGHDEIPDLLTINLASNDYVGHRYGPDSAEVLDITVQTDRVLSEFLNFLEKSVPGGLASVTFALCADHGVLSVPEDLTAAGVPAGRSVTAAIKSAAEQALDEGVGAADWIASTDNGELYFAPAALATYPKESRRRLEERVVEAVQQLPTVFLAVGKSAVLAGQVPMTPIGRRISMGVNAARSGDVIVILDPQWLAGAAPVGTGTSHGTPFNYDTHVPLLLAGFGVQPGVYTTRVAPAQIAPTLSHLLGVARPSAADGALLPGLAGAGR